MFLVFAVGPTCTWIGLDRVS